MAERQLTNGTRIENRINAFIYLSDIAKLAIYLYKWVFVFYSLENIDFGLCCIKLLWFFKACIIIF